MKILVKDKETNIRDFELPMLISGSRGSGASYFSVVLISQLINLGEKVVYFCKAEPGVKLLQELTDVSKASGQIIIVNAGDKRLFKQTLEDTNDLDTRIVFVKNIESILDKESFELIKKARGYILSGDTDLCSVVEPTTYFNSKVFFSDSEKMNFILPEEVERYEGIIVGSSMNGPVKILS